MGFYAREVVDEDPLAARQEQAPSRRRRRERRVRSEGAHLRSSREPFRPSNPYAPPTVEASDDRAGGNFWLGVMLGSFGGLLALALMAGARSDTRRGALWGFGAQLLFAAIIAAAR